MISFEQLYWRVMLMIRRGKITLVNDAGPVQMIQLPPSGLEGRDNLARIGEYGLASNPPDGTDAYVANIGGDPSNGAVIGTNHQATRPTGLQSGEAQLYNGPAGTSVYLANGEIVVNANGQQVQINNATIVTINAATEVIMETPVLKVSGDIVDNYHTNSSTVAELRTAHDGHDHQVVNVQTGGSTIVTSGPDLSV
ncbi:phage baseplate assembly protein V [Paraburkholderia terrae]|uniref:phage baseplate assembly protein V n=1 Tax=Paraburkholderia terrae TaxID=311230 RepID=UPI00296AE289|nr:phage baseplate assembly protein V [Paraburkholderia terrae]MDW3655475.1 phage baseplate assembly protein V [Paraburkholderia terrae]